MSVTLFLIFNHRFTPSQEADARRILGVERIAALPGDLQQLWRQIPPDLPEISGYLEALRGWLLGHARNGDFVLIQGDFGACYLMVECARQNGLVPVYSTTRREAAEEIQSDGTVKLTHHFEHRMFREYGR
jgi:hypothetical protein